MTLEIFVDHDGTEYTIEIDQLVSHGEYFRDPDTGLIIRTSGSFEESASGDNGVVETGTDYRLVPVEIDHSTVRREIDERLGIELTDDELDELIDDYQRTSCEFADLKTQGDGHRLLKQARQGIMTVDVDKWLRGLNEDYEDIVDRAVEANPEKSPGNVWTDFFSALQRASPGGETYAAKVELID